MKLNPQLGFEGNAPLLAAWMEELDWQDDHLAAEILLSELDTFRVGGSCATTARYVLESIKVLRGNPACGIILRWLYYRH